MPLLPVLRKSPFARLLIFFVAGIATSNALRLQGSFTIEMAIILIVLWSALLMTILFYQGYNAGWVSGILASATLFACGIWSMEIQLRQERLTETIPPGCHIYRIRIIDLPDIRENRIRATARVLACRSGSLWKNKNFRLLVYLDRTKETELINPGSEIQIRATLTPVPGPSNPGEFSYKHYLAARHIYLQAFVRPGSWMICGSSPRSFHSWSCRMRQQLLNSLENLHLEPQDCALLSAITLGYKEGLDTHTRQVFTRAGVMHIMALSGFNVGIIALALGFILGILDFNTTGKAAKILIIIFILWLFAWVTGLSASVTRATLTISFVLAGRLFHKSINNYNVLFASAFLILALSPGMLTDVSFQLSVAAVTGIILYQPILNGYITFKNSLARKIWQLFTLTCAAQLATFPISLYYFHQFPVYFWLTNLYVVPLVSIIVCTSCIYLPFSFFNPVVIYFGKVLAILVKALFLSVSVVEDLPFSLVSGVHISGIQAVFLVIMLLLLAVFVLYNKMGWLMAFMFMLLIFVSMCAMHNFKLNTQRIYLVGKIRGESAVSFVSGRRSLLLLGSGIHADQGHLKYALGEFWIEHGVDPFICEMDSIAEFRKRSPVIQGLHCRLGWRGNNCMIGFGKERLIILRDNNFYRYRSLKPLMTDVLIISRGLSVNTDKIAREIKPSLVILDSSITGYRLKLWEKAFESSGVRCYSVIDKGAYVAHSLADYHR